MSNERQNVIVNAPNSEPPSTPATPATSATLEVTPVVAQAINQAQNYGEMTEAFRQTREEAAQTRLEMQLMKEELKSNQAMYQVDIQALREQNNKLLQALEEEEEEEEIQSQASLSGTTVITPPPITVAATQEQPAKKKQSRMNRILFGADDEE